MLQFPLANVSVSIFSFGAGKQEQNVQTDDFIPFLLKTIIQYP